MAEFVNIGDVSEYPSDSMKTVQVAGKRVAVANVSGLFFAIDDRCSHEECSLGSEGFLDGETVICGCHGAQFDVTTGAVLSLPATVSVESYEVKVEAGIVLIKI